MTKKNLIFYDGTCPFCNFWVQKLLLIDKKKLFKFAPLSGKRATRDLKGISRGNTLVFLQDYDAKKVREFVEGEAILRIFWVLGGVWAFFGIFAFLPSAPFNWIYRLVAKNRSRLFTSCKIMPLPSDRFLE